MLRTRLSVLLALCCASWHNQPLLCVFNWPAGNAEVSREKKADLFHVLDADHDGVLSVEEQRGARAYTRED